MTLIAWEYIILKRMPDVVVQTVLERSVALWIKKQARAEGASVAAWMRRMVMRRYETAVVRAWIRRPNERRTELERIWTGRQAATFLLEKVEGDADGSVEFRALNLDGVPFTSVGHYSYSPLRENLAHGWFALDGSMVPWEVVHTMSDASVGGQLVLRLRPDRESRDGGGDA